MRHCLSCRPKDETQKLPRTVLAIITAVVLVLFQGRPMVQAEELTMNDLASAPQSQDYRTLYVFNEQTGVWQNDSYAWNPQTYSVTTTSPTFTVQPSASIEEKSQELDAPEVFTALGSSDGEASEEPTTAPTPGGSVIIDEVRESTAYDTPRDTAELISSTDTTLQSSLSSFAQSGDVLVTQNTQAGDGISGDSLVHQIVMNGIQNAWSPLSNPVTYFTKDIHGTNVGDLVVDPGVYKGTVLPIQAHGAATSVDISSDTEIASEISVSSRSGNVEISNNTVAGNATSGNATALINAINLINSLISSGDAFIGTINIYGSLDGDILFPDNFLDKVLSAGEKVYSDDGVYSSATLDSAITSTVRATAESGKVEMTQNTASKDATSGSASTEVNVMNISGKDIVGDNALLVFINVAGKWVGVLMDAPAHSNSALIGSAMASSPLPASLAKDIQSSNKISSSIDAEAISGDVTVKGNTLSGHATSGDARTVVNLANMSYSAFSTTRWFGILFVNVFGDWQGSFGINTSAGGPIKPLPNEFEEASEMPVVIILPENKMFEEKSSATTVPYLFSTLDGPTVTIAKVKAALQSQVVSNTGIDTPSQPKSVLIDLVSLLAIGTVIATLFAKKRRS